MVVPRVECPLGLGLKKFYSQVRDHSGSIVQSYEEREFMCLRPFRADPAMLIAPPTQDSAVSSGSSSSAQQCAPTEPTASSRSRDRTLLWIQAAIDEGALDDSDALESAQHAVTLAASAAEARDEQRFQ